MQDKDRRMTTKALVQAIALVGVVVVLAGLARSLSPIGPHSVELGTLSGVPKTSEKYGTAKWEYGEAKDQMRGTVTKYATLASSTDLALPAPYDGENGVDMFVGHEGQIMLSVAKGQFVCEQNGGVFIKVDQGPVWRYPCSTGDNGENNRIFLGEREEQIDGQPFSPRELLYGRKMTVEASFFNAGTRQIEFNIHSFKASKIGW